MWQHYEEVGGRLALEDVIHIEDGLAVFSREGIYQMRLKVAPQKYVYRTLKTRNKRDAVAKAKEQFYFAKFKKAEGGTYLVPTFAKVIEDYTKQRDLDHKRGKVGAGMIYQIKRVQKFWIEYVGKMPVDKVGEKELREYIDWRVAYYSKIPEKQRPTNSKLHPTDTTLLWEVTFAKTVIKWAHQKGYRGKQPLPVFTPKMKQARVRPAFEIGEYKRLYQTLRKRTFETTNAAWKHTRLILRDYVLILSNSGMRVGELNKIKMGDIHPFTDKKGRPNYRFIVKGKTGPRDVILRASAKRWVDRQIERRKEQKAKDSDYLFVMYNGGKIINLIDQFTEVLKAADLETNGFGERYSLYSLRHFYTVQCLIKGNGVFEVARNMGTSVEILQKYYGKSATSAKFATGLGD